MTGGGPYTDKPLSEIEMAVSDLIGVETLHGTVPSYDSDNNRANNIPQENIVLVVEDEKKEEVAEDFDYAVQGEVFEDEEKNLPSTSTGFRGSWETYCPKDLQQPISEKLVTPKRGGKSSVKIDERTKVSKIIDTKSGQLISKKIEFVGFQKEKFEEEHELRMKNLRSDEIIKAKKLELLELDIQIKKKQLSLLEN
uniref:Uncharacterized protein LOC114347019 n=1 Tax=Diabrotica virgifera virgifera TaxID=50390 RepID=A0A6P7H4U0_DIAVI